MIMKKTILYLLIPFVLILIITGTIFQIVGRTISALSYLFWFDVDRFKIDMYNLWDDIKEWYLQ